MLALLKRPLPMIRLLLSFHRLLLYMVMGFRTVFPPFDAHHCIEGKEGKEGGNGDRLVCLCSFDGDRGRVERERGKREGKENGMKRDEMKKKGQPARAHFKKKVMDSDRQGAGG